MTDTALNETRTAVLSAVHQPNMALLAAELPLQLDDDGWVQLLPAGQFQARDGRPDIPGGHWILKGEIAQRLIALAALRCAVTICSSTTNTRPCTPKPTASPPQRLAGFPLMRSVGVKGRSSISSPAGPSAPSQAHRRAEYKYLSAVFPYNAQGEPLELCMAALTNDPGVTGMEQLAALAARKFTDHPLTHNNPTQEPSVMNEQLKKLLTALGITLANGAELTDEHGQAAVYSPERLKTV